MIKKVHDVLIYQRTYHKDIATRFSPREGFEDLVFTSKTNNPINAANIKDLVIVARGISKIRPIYIPCLQSRRQPVQLIYCPT